MMSINMMWEKKGFIFKPKGDKSWSRSHAQVPFALPLDDNLTRIFYSTRDSNSCSAVSFIDVVANNPSKIVYEHPEPVLTKGSPGSFDDSGTMPSWFVYKDSQLYLYYTGWNKSEAASYRLSIGLAVSDDQGKTFRKMFKGPIMDRGKYDPIWVGQPCVLREGKEWKMWYLSCEKIEMIDDHPEPFYNVKYATSKDGINWDRKNHICIDFKFGKIDAIGRPCVWKHGSKYWMLHSNRQAVEYRDNEEASYRIELSESINGKNWKQVEAFKMEKFDNGEWDALMNEYTTIVETTNKGEFYVFYNGNGFGASGFGYFILNISE